MSIEQPLPHIYRIQLPTPYPVGPVNCYLLDGPEPVLVDCGPATAQAEQTLRAALETLRLQPRDISRIVLTHHHPDHAGGLAWLRRETAALILGHRYCDLWLLSDPALVEARLAYFIDLYRYCGATAQLAAGLRSRFSDYGTLEGPRIVQQVSAEGAVLDLGGSLWQVFETPGHAGTHLGFLRDDGTFLAGDTLLERISSNALAEPPYPGEQDRHSSLLTYRRTLRRLADLPLALVLPGHGSTYTVQQTLIARRIKGQDERAQRLLALLRPAPATVLALSERLFPGLSPDQLFLGLSEVLGHLDLLEEEGRARHEGSSPALYHAD